MTTDPNPFTRVFRNMFTDEDFRALSPDARWTFVMLLCQPEYASSGVLTVALKRWARYTGLSTERLLAALRELDTATFVVFDADEDELLIRTRLRNDTLTSGSWKTHKGALTYCLKAVSGRVRAALAVEILTATDQCLIRPEVAEYAKEVVAELQRDTCIEASIEAGTDTAISNGNRRRH